MNCIIDGNYILSKLVFTLHKNNLLFGNLYQSLNNTIANYRKWYPFSNVYLVSDSKEKSWRKSLDANYKLGRKRDSEIDWGFAYSTYESFKKSLQGAKVMESPTIEGDDWISFIVDKSNENGMSNLIISNDHDIKQLIRFNLDKEWINVMSNEMYNREKVFLPINYKTFLSKISQRPSDDIFNLTDNVEFISLLKKFSSKYEVVEIDNLQSLIVKIISGDSSDNIQSVYQTNNNGKIRGIGSKGALTICEDYFKEFGEISLEDPDLFENIADLICEKKKLSKTNIGSIMGNISKNMKLIDLRMSNLPKEIIDTMESVYEKHTHLWPS